MRIKTRAPLRLVAACAASLALIAGAGPAVGAKQGKGKIVFATNHGLRVVTASGTFVRLLGNVPEGSRRSSRA